MNSLEKILVVSVNSTVFLLYFLCKNIVSHVQILYSLHNMKNMLGVTGTIYILHNGRLHTVK